MRYTPIKRTYVPLAWISHKWKCYTRQHHVKFLTQADLIKYLYSRPDVSDGPSRWTMLPHGFGMEVVI